MLNVAQIIAETEAEGPGRRFAIWVQGCPLRCPGCCNPQMLRFDQEPGEGVIDPAALAERVLATPGIDGVSLLGGEPFAQAEGLAEVAERVRARGLDVMIYSGFTLSELREKATTEPGVQKLLAQCDLLVDGPYDRDRPEHTSMRPRRWIGGGGLRQGAIQPEGSFAQLAARYPVHIEHACQLDADV